MFELWSQFRFPTRYWFSDVENSVSSLENGQFFVSQASGLSARVILDQGATQSTITSLISNDTVNSSVFRYHNFYRVFQRSDGGIDMFTTTLNSAGDVRTLFYSRYDESGNYVSGPERVRHQLTDATALGEESYAFLFSQPFGLYLQFWETDGELNDTILVTTNHPDNDGGSGEGLHMVANESLLFIAWEDHDTGLIFARLFDHHGQAQGDIFQFTPGERDPDVIEMNLQLAVLEDGGFIAGWNQVSSDGSGGSAAILQRFNTQGLASGAAVEIGAGQSGEFAILAIETTQNGGYIVLWEHVNASDGTSTRMLSRYDAEGELEFAPFKVANFEGPNIEIIAFEDGRIGLIGGGSVSVYDSRSGDVTGDEGNNFLNATAVNGTSVFGLDGNDRLVSGDADNTLIGGAGDDQLVSGLGNDELFGGDGDDQYYIVGGGNAVVIENGGEGTDTVHARDNFVLPGHVENGVVISYVFDPQTREAGYTGYIFDTTSSANISGNSLSNVLTGNWEDNELTGHGGNDTIYGLGNNDTLYGNDGNDHLIGGSGNDFLDGGSGRDILEGGTRNDIFNIGAATDVVAGEVIDGGEDRDQVVVSILSGVANLNLATILNVEELHVTSSHISLSSEQFNSFDQMYFFGTIENLNTVELTSAGVLNWSNVSLSDGLFVRHSDGGNTSDFRSIAIEGLIIEGGGGDDTIYLSTSGGEVNGGGGNDSIYLSDQGDEAEGGSGNDLINGGAGHDVIRGNAGDDHLRGNDGNDQIYAGTGIDRIEGGAGSDRFFVSSLDDLSAGDIISGGTGFDTIVFSQEVTEADIHQVSLSGVERLDFSGADLDIHVSSSQLSSMYGAANGELAHIFVTDSGDLNLDYFDDLLSIEESRHFGTIHLSSDGNQVRLTTRHSELSGSFIGGEANDSVTVDVAHFSSQNIVNTTFIGGEGDDVFTSLNQGRLLFLGGVGDDQYVGHDSEDVFLPGMGEDSFTGGASLDRLVFVEAQEVSAGDNFDGGDDIDVIDIDGAIDNIDLSLASISNFEAIVTRNPNGTNVTLTTELFEAMQVFNFAEGTQLVFANSGDVTVDPQLINQAANFTVQLSDQGNNLDLNGLSFSPIRINGGRGVDQIRASTGNDMIDGGSNVDTAVVSGNLADYTVTQTSTGVFEVSGADGTDTLTNIEYLQFDDQTMRLRIGEGVSVNFETADPSVYQSAMSRIRDFDGNALGGFGSWLRIGEADINGDGDIDQILVNSAIGRFATIGTAPDGLVYFDDHGWAGETRVAGIYIDPLVASGEVVAGSDNDSQRRFQNDLEIENINRVLGADDYDGDGVQEVFFALTDGTAYLRALMHDDGNIRYANYQSEQQVRDYLVANGYDEDTFGDWFGDAQTQSSDTLTFTQPSDKQASDKPAGPQVMPALEGSSAYDSELEQWLDSRLHELSWVYSQQTGLDFFV